MWDMFYIKASIYASWFSVLIPLAMYVVRKKCLSQTYFKVLFILLATSALSDLICFILAKSGIPNISVVNIYIITEFILISIIYAVLAENMKAIIYVVTVLYINYFLFTSFYLGGINELQYFTYLIGSVCVMLFVFMYLVNLHATIDTMTPFFYPPIWISVALLSSFAYIIYVFITNDRPFDHYTPAEYYNYWFYQNVNSVIKNLLLAVAVFFSNRIHITTDEHVIRKHEEG